MEKISIRNFGGIKALEFEFRSFNVLVGPNDAGKSLSMKLHYFFRSLFEELRLHIFYDKAMEGFEWEQKERFQKYFPVHTWPLTDFSIVYTLDDMEVAAKKIKGHFKIKYSAKLEKAISNTREAFKVYEGPEDQSPYQQKESGRDFIFDHFREATHHLLAHRTYFISEQRSVFADMQESLFQECSAFSALNPFVKICGRNYNNEKGLFSIEPGLVNKAFMKNVMEILNARFLRDSEKDHLVYKGGRKVNLASVPVSYKEVIPLIVILGVISMKLGDKRMATVYIDDPETHLSPAAQRVVGRLITTVFNEDTQIFLTTRSPYVIAAINEAKLPAAHMTGYFVNNGKQENIVDKDGVLVLPADW